MQIIIEFEHDFPADELWETATAIERTILDNMGVPVWVQVVD